MTRIPRVSALALAATLLASCRSTPPKDQAGNPDGKDQPAPTDTLAKPTFADFSERIEIYMNQRRRAEASVPDLKETSDPKKVSDREKALGNAIRTVRANAPQGEIFSEAAAAEFRRIVAADFMKRTPKARSAVDEPADAARRPRIPFSRTPPHSARHQRECDRRLHP
jgi:hypothetical protein